jgi:hypothetical protein
MIFSPNPWVAVVWNAVSAVPRCCGMCQTRRGPEISQVHGSTVGSRQRDPGGISESCLIVRRSLHKSGKLGFNSPVSHHYLQGYRLRRRPYYKFTAIDVLQCPWLGEPVFAAAQCAALPRKIRPTSPNRYRRDGHHCNIRFMRVASTSFDRTLPVMVEQDMIKIKKMPIRVN